MRCKTKYKFTNIYYTRSSSYGSGLRKQQQQQMNVRYGGSVSPSLCIDKVDNIIDMPGKGWCFVYVARYSYDPFQVWWRLENNLKFTSFTLFHILFSSSETRNQLNIIKR